LAAIHQRTLELIVRDAPLQDLLGALCDGIACYRYRDVRRLGKPETGVR